jgi:hypothetical protein
MSPEFKERDPFLTELITKTPIQELDSAFRLMLQLQKHTRSTPAANRPAQAAHDPHLSANYPPDSPRNSASFTHSAQNDSKNNE